MIDIKFIKQILTCSYHILIHHPPILNKLEICLLLHAAHDMMYRQEMDKNTYHLGHAAYWKEKVERLQKEMNGFNNQQINLLPDDFEWSDIYWNEYMWENEDDMYDAYYHFHDPWEEKFSTFREEMNVVLKATYCALGYHKTMTNEQEESWINTVRMSLNNIEIHLIEGVLAEMYCILNHHPPLLDENEFATLIMVAHEIKLHQQIDKTTFHLGHAAHLKEKAEHLQKELNDSMEEEEIKT
jgi:hypothetical protein